LRQKKERKPESKEVRIRSTHAYCAHKAKLKDPELTATLFVLSTFRLLANANEQQEKQYYHPPKNNLSVSMALLPPKQDVSFLAPLPFRERNRELPVEEAALQVSWEVGLRNMKIFQTLSRNGVVKRG
jgi:hypothetical protein